MRVLMVLGRSSGGIGAHVDALTTDLRRLGHQVRIVTDAGTAEHFGWSDADQLWPLRGGAGLIEAPLDWHRIRRLAQSCDVVHAHGHQAALVAAIAVLRAGRQGGPPALVVSLHNDLPASGAGVRTFTAAIGWALRRADLVTGASPDLVALARECGAHTVELATVASPRVAALLADEGKGAAPGPDPQRDPQRHQQDRRNALRRQLLAGAGIDDPGRPLVLTVSRVAPQKDLSTLVQAAARSRVPATWVVVGGGDDPLRARLEQELRGIRTEAGVELHFVGPCSDVSSWLRAATVFALSSRWEARALVVQEAMAAGLPVVATRVGGLPELVGGAGLLVPPGDPPALAEAVDALLRDPERAARLGIAGRLEAASWATPGQEARRWGGRYATLRPG
ncbi:MAG: glycosyltransferase family 4 protein [Micrococcales bacterium]|nr:glycosyltransferase family 4 protein [Micrococcales bacterium]